MLKNELFKGVDSKGSLYTYVTSTVNCRACKQFQISVTLMWLKWNSVKVGIHVLIGMVVNWMLHIGPEFGGQGQELGHELVSESGSDLVNKISAISRSWNQLKLFLFIFYLWIDIVVSTIIIHGFDKLPSSLSRKQTLYFTVDICCNPRISFIMIYFAKFQHKKIS